jgi:hypothetical protein
MIESVKATSTGICFDFKNKSYTLKCKLISNGVDEWHNCYLVENDTNIELVALSTKDDFDDPRYSIPEQVLKIYYLLLHWGEYEPLMKSLYYMMALKEQDEITLLDEMITCLSKNGEN